MSNARQGLSIYTPVYRPNLHLLRSKVSRTHSNRRTGTYALQYAICAFSGRRSELL